MIGAAPPLSTMHLWRVSAARAPTALARMATDRYRLAAVPGLRFWKLLGTGDGRSFDRRDADLRTWVLFAVWHGPEALAAFERTSPVANGWRRLARQRWRADMVPLASRGSWGGANPFEGATPAAWAPPDHATASRWDGPVAALTRARLRWGRMSRFWQAVPPVAAELADAPGLRAGLAIGEAPVGVQGTFSVWDSAQAMHDFAYGRGRAHLDAVRRTAAEGWYAEDLFARFAVLQATAAGPPAGEPAVD